MSNSISNKLLSSSEILPTQSTTVGFSVERGVGGDVPDVALRVDEEIIRTERFEVPEGESTVVEFEVDFPEAGEYSVDAQVSDPASLDAFEADGYTVSVSWDNSNARFRDIFIPDEQGMDRSQIEADTDFPWRTVVVCDSTNTPCSTFETALTVDGSTYVEQHDGDSATDFAAGTATVSEGTHTATVELRLASKPSVVLDSATRTIEAVELAPEFSDANHSISTLSIDPGDTITATVDVTNTGTAAGDYTSTLNVGDSITNRETATISAGETVTIEHRVTVDTMGPVGITLDRVTLGVVDVGDPLSADLFEITTCQIVRDSPGDITEPETVELGARVDSSSFEAARVTVEWTVGPYTKTATTTVPANRSSRAATELTIDPSVIGGGTFDVNREIVAIESA